MTQTRSRPYRKNDQAWVEQKNGAVVRRLVGHGRLQGINAAQALARLYAVSRLHVNYFQPSFKLKDKQRQGAKVTKHHHPPATPFERLLTSGHLQPIQRKALQDLYVTFDPLHLLHEVRSAQAAVAALVVSDEDPQELPRDDTLATFLAQLPTLWEEGEARPTHRQPLATPRNYRTRKDPFALAWAEMESWLCVEPEITAKALFQRLREKYPDAYTAGQLRTLQRRVQAWRRAMARRLIFGERNQPSTVPGIDPQQDQCGKFVGTNQTQLAASQTATPCLQKGHESTNYPGP